MSTVEVTKIVVKPLTSLLDTGQFSALQDCLAAAAEAATYSTSALSSKNSATNSAASAAVYASAASNAAASVPNVGTGPSDVGTNSHNASTYAPIAHASNTSNPHSTTASQVGLGNVSNVAQLPLSYLDTDNTLASDSDTKVPSQKAVKAHVATAAAAAISGHGYCRLAKVSTDLVLQRVGPGYLIINGVVRQVPVAGVSLAATGLSAGTTYNIYAYMNGSTMTLEASATAYATDATTGIVIKSGDATRTLVGMARVISGPAFADIPTRRYVLSYFNRRRMNAYRALGSNQTTTTTANFVDMDSGSHVEFLCWGDEDVFVAGTFYAAGGQPQAQVGLDGATTPVGAAMLVASSSTMMCNSATFSRLAEGYHYVCFACIQSGTGTLTLYAAYSTLTVGING